jgi:hypothetical protein
MPMSEEEIYKYCRNINRRISFGAPIAPKVASGNILSPYQPISFMGIDWGGKSDDPNVAGGKSFSSIVVLSLDRNGVLNVENAFKLKRNDLEHKKEVVHEMFRRFDIKISIADLGFGSDIVPDLQREYSSRLIGCLSSGSLLNPVKYDPEELRMICNPHVVLDDLFGQMRRSKIMFPWQSYEQIQWLIEHCCSMERETRTIQGQVLTKYVKGSGPNDGLMALMYAFLAYKFFITQGFKVKPHQLNAKSNGPVLAFLPNM